MADLKLNPVKIAEAIETIETYLGEKSLEQIEERAVIVKSASESSYKEDLIRCEKVNEENYNNSLPLVKAVRDCFTEIKEVAETLAKRQLETTKAREADGHVEAIDAVSALRPM